MNYWKSKKRMLTVIAAIQYCTGGPRKKEMIHMSNGEKEINFTYKQHNCEHRTRRIHVTIFGINKFCCRNSHTHTHCPCPYLTWIWHRQHSIPVCWIIFHKGPLGQFWELSVWSRIQAGKFPSGQGQIRGLPVVQPAIPPSLPRKRWEICCWSVEGCWAASNYPVPTLTTPCEL